MRSIRRMFLLSRVTSLAYLDDREVDEDEKRDAESMFPAAKNKSSRTAVAAYASASAVEAASEDFEVPGRKIKDAWRDFKRKAKWKRDAVQRRVKNKFR